MKVVERERETRFEELFERFLRDMVAYCTWRAPSPADAEDAVSDVFLVAWRRLEEVPDGAEARPWLYATARRVMANQARAGRRRALLHVRLNALPVNPQPAPLRRRLSYMKPSAVCGQWTRRSSSWRSGRG